MTELGDLFDKYGSDKVRSGYHTAYAKALGTKRKSIKAVLEVGIGTMIPGVHSSMVNYAAPHYLPGGSLRAWRDYFPNAQIVGLDVQPDTQFSEDRIGTLLGDSSDVAEMESLFPNETFDLIVDDGDHTRQFETLLALWPKLKIGGTYAIEDIWGVTQSLIIMTRRI